MADKGRHDEHRVASRYPVCESVLPTLSKDEEWAKELSRWYESDWQHLVQSSDRPFADKVLQSLEEAQRVVAQPLFEAIDSHYLPILSERSRGTVDDAGEATIELPTSRSSGDGVQADPEGHHDAQSRPAAADDDETTAPPATLVLDADGIVQADPQTLDFSDGAADAEPSPRQVSIRSNPTSARRLKNLPQIPGYVIHSVLGQGAMGVVYFATQIGIERQVALKMILAGVHSSRSLLDRFLAEAKAVGRLQHENIVRIYEVGWHHELPYFSLEYVDGPALSQKIGGEPMDPLEAATLVAPLASALQYAHDAGIIHRDIKPGNVLVSSTGVPKLADFGLAKQLEDNSDLSRTGDILGTPAYMAPEQARGAREITGAADVYGLGGVLYCMITGRAPFTSTKSVDTIVQVLNDDPVKPSRLQPGVPKDLETICLKCLQKDPAQRYPTARELEADLIRFTEGVPIAARPVGHVERVYRWSRRQPRIAALIATATVFALILMIGGPIVASVIYAQKQDILDSKQLAETNAIEATENAAIAEANEKEAEANAEAALVQERNAVDALKSLVFEVQRTMQDKPGLQDTRRALLGVAREGLKRLDGAGELNQTPSIVAAGICRHLGDINMELGQVQAAGNLYHQCLDNLQRLEQAGELPERGYRHNLSTSYELLATAYRRLGRLNEAWKYGELCLQHRRLWAQEEPDNEDVRQNLAATLGQLGVLAQEKGNMEKAHELLSESEQMRREYVELRPGAVGPLTEWLGARRALARHAFQAGRIEVATTAMTEVIEQQTELADRFPHDVSYRGNLALFLSDLATFYVYGAQYQKAVEQYSNAVETQRKLIEEDPKNFSLKEHLASSLYGLSLAQFESGDDATGSKTLAECLDLRRAARQLDPASLTREVLWLLTTARSGNIEQAVSAAERLEPQLKNDAGMYYHLGCVYSQFFAAAKKGAALPAGVTPGQFAEEALRLIGKSHELGFRRSTDLKRDPELAPLRESPKYQSLIAAYH